MAHQGRCVMAQLTGTSAHPYVCLAHLDAAQRRAYVLADNKLALNAGRDHELHAIKLQGLMALDFDIEVTDSRLPRLTLCLTRCWRNGPTKAEAGDEVPFRAGGSASAVTGPDRSRKLKWERL
jgi:hypothetical protein